MNKNKNKKKKQRAHTDAEREQQSNVYHEKNSISNFFSIYSLFAVADCDGNIIKLSEVSGSLNVDFKLNRRVLGGDREAYKTIS